MGLSVHGGHLPPLNSFQHIPQNMPLWMSATGLLYVAGVSLVPPCPESLADLLRFFAGNQYAKVYLSLSPFLLVISCIHFRLFLRTAW